MKSHIETVVERYYDVIDNWDVVNEAVNDDGTYRQSNWWNIFQSREYIYWAFKYAKDALEAYDSGTGTSAGKLYYNDYSVPNTNKFNGILNMLRWLNGEEGPGTLPAGQSAIKIDGVGFQAHYKHAVTSWPSTAQIQTAMNAFTGDGYKVKFSELDLSIYANSGEAQKTFTAAIDQEQADRCRDLFELFRANAANITSVTFWGVSDDRTWLDSWPVAGRNDYPLLFNDRHDAKLAYYSIIAF